MSRENGLSEKVLQSYVYSEKGKFFVSTIYRESSAMIEPPVPWFYETFAWTLDEHDKKKDWIADNSGASYIDKALDQHIEVCKQLYETGEFKDKEE